MFQGFRLLDSVTMLRVSIFSHAMIRPNDLPIPLVSLLILILRVYIYIKITVILHRKIQYSTDYAI